MDVAATVTVTADDVANHAATYRDFVPQAGAVDQQKNQMCHEGHDDQQLDGRVP